MISTTKILTVEVPAIITPEGIRPGFCETDGVVMRIAAEENAISITFARRGDGPRFIGGDLRLKISVEVMKVPIVTVRVIGGACDGTVLARAPMMEI